MAFTPQTLYTARAVANAVSYGEAAAISTYTSEDLLTEVATPGYFPDFFGVDPIQIKIGDVLVLMAADIRLLAVIISVAPVLLDAFTDFPQNLVTQSITQQSNEYSGVWASPIPILLDFIQQGNECLITFPSGIDLSTGGANISFTSPVIPSAFPLFEVSTPIEILDNSISEIGTLILRTDGTIEIFRLNGTPFTASGNAGFPSTMVKYRTI